MICENEFKQKVTVFRAIMRKWTDWENIIREIKIWWKNMVCQTLAYSDKFSRISHIIWQDTNKDIRPKRLKKKNVRKTLF